MKKDFRLFFIMFGIATFLNVGYALLRSLRTTLAVVDLGDGAGSIPLFELCGSMPGAVLMTMGLTWLLNRFNIYKAFLITLSCFVGFFVAFVTCIYPFLVPGTWIAKGASMLFFTMAELWKIGLFTVLFWGLINQHLPLEKAKKFYAPLMVGASIGTLLSGPLIELCKIENSWIQSLHWMIGSLTLLSAITLWLFYHLWKSFAGPKREEVPSENPRLSVLESLRVCLRSPQLMLLGWITIATYVAYALGEVLFLDILKQKFPSPVDYCSYHGKLSLWSGLLTALSALIITPLLLRRCRWVVTSLITPICLLVTEVAFFGSLWIPSLHIDVAIIFGTLMFCLLRAAKFTLFDTSKELSFLLLPPLEKMQGKLIIDGICSRAGRGGASLLSIFLIQAAGGVLASSPIAGVLAILISGSCVFSTARLGALLEKRSAQQSNAP